MADDLMDLIKGHLHSDAEVQMSIAREMGDHNARLKTLERDVSDIKSGVNAMLTKMSEVKGSWKTLLILASIAATVGAIGAQLTKTFHL